MLGHVCLARRRSGGGGWTGVRGRGRGTHVAHRNVLDQLGVDAGALAHLLQKRVDHVLERRVLEAALARLAQRGAGGEGDDDVVGVLGEPARLPSAASSGKPGGGQRKGREGRGSLHFIEPRAGVDVLEDGSNALSRHGVGIGTGTGYLFSESKNVWKREWKMNSKRARSRKNNRATRNLGPSSPINTEYAPAGSVGKSSGCLQIEPNGSYRRGWRPTPSQHLRSALAGQDVLDRGTRRAWGKEARSPLFTPCLRRYCVVLLRWAPLAAVWPWGIWGGVEGFGSGFFCRCRSRGQPGGWAFGMVVWCCLLWTDICRRWGTSY